MDVQTGILVLFGLLAYLCLGAGLAGFTSSAWKKEDRAGCIMISVIVLWPICVCFFTGSTVYKWLLRKVEQGERGGAEDEGNG